MEQREEGISFAAVNGAQASGILEDILRENSALLGGSSIGQGFGKAARYHIRETLVKRRKQLDHPDLDLQSPVLEDSFYVVDLGVVVSQVFQWRKYFPRVQPFYAVKCNPDPVILKTLAILGCSFDCASLTEINIVQDVCKDLPRKPEIIYANPCKARNHLIQAVIKGVQMVTFDNVSEVHKCAAISKKIQLILRIVTDDRGAQCRLSSKYGAPRARWRNLLMAAKQSGLQVIGVSFHVGSGCRDSARYEAALKDARELFDLGKNYGFDMNILDIGGGFPGETHSVWNPEVLDETESDSSKEGLECTEGEDDTPYMFFTEVAEAVAPIIDDLFPSDIRVIGEPGRYFVAAAATLVASIVGSRSNEVDECTFDPEAFPDAATSVHVEQMTREESNEVVRKRGVSFDEGDDVLENIADELSDYAKLHAKQTLVQQEADVYNDALDLYYEDIDTAADLLGVPDMIQRKKQVHTVEGLTKGIVMREEEAGLISLAAAGEAAVNGIVMQAVVDSAPFQDDYAYYINDGVYGAFNNLMFDHASVRPRVLRNVIDEVQTEKDDGLVTINQEVQEEEEDQLLYASTVFGPTCDSIDVISRSVLLPKLKIGDWLYFQNMGAYTMAAASSFNGFEPTEKMYVCSVQPEFFEGLIAGPPEAEDKSSEDSKPDETQKQLSTWDEKKDAR